MADTYTAFLNLTRPEVGASRDAWGDKWNANATALDNWAAATDALAKDALAKKGVTTVNAQGQTVPVTQAVAGPVSFTGAVTASAGITLPENQYLFAGKGYLRGESNRTLLAAAADNFEVVNQANSQYIFQANLTSFLYRGGLVWHQGNFTPAEYFNKASATAQQVSNSPSFNVNYIDIVRSNVIRWRVGPQTDSYFRLSNGDSGAQAHAFGPGGDIWTVQMGDLNARIENRAADFANDRLATARAEYANHAKLSGGTFTGGISVPVVDIVGAGGALTINSRNGDKGALLYNHSGTLRIYDTAGADRVRFNLYTGATWFEQIGDLNDRIENRAYAWANDRLAVARAEFANRVVRTGDTMTGDFHIAKDTPRIYLRNTNGRVWALTQESGNDGLSFYKDHGGSGRPLYFGADGSIYSSQMGDINGRIDARAADFANDRKAAAIAETQAWTLANFNNKTSPNLQDHSGDIRINKGNPSLHLLFGNVYSGRLWIGNDAIFRYSNNDGGGDQFRISPGGAVWTLQFGDLNNRIEDRAYAYRNDAINVCRNEYANHAKTNVYNEFSQDQRISKAYPEFQWLWGGKARWGILLQDDNSLWFRRPDDNYCAMAIRYGGAVHVGQFGDLHDRIENRAYAWANDKANEAKNEAARITGRLAYAGDLSNDWNINGGGGDPYAEPYPGGVITTRYTTSYASVSYWSGARWRYMQMKGTNDAWYTISYV